MGVGNLPGLAIGLLVIGIVVFVALLIMGSFQTTINKNGEATNGANTAISNSESSFNLMLAIPIVISLAVFILLIIRSLSFGGRKEEARD